MTLNRREFAQGLGIFGLGFLFRNKVTKELVPEPTYLLQPPSAVDIVAETQLTFRPQRLVTPPTSHDFVIENISVGDVAQMIEGDGIPASIFGPTDLATNINLDVAGPGAKIKFRVRYVGDNPEGEIFRAALVGDILDGRLRKGILPISSGIRIVA